MSNYMIVIAGRRPSQEVAAWVAATAPDLGEHLTVTLSRDYDLHYFARDAALDVDADGGILFKGFAVDYDQRSIVFGASGMSDFVTSNPNRSEGLAVEGCHISAQWTADAMTVSNDLFSICSMLYTAENDFVAMSDSAYMLCALRRRLGYTNTLNSEVAIARSWGNSMGGQLLSPDTVVDSVKYAPVGTSLRVAFAGMLSLTVVRKPVEEVFELRSRSYSESMKTAAQRMASLIHTLSGISINAVRLSLSGGMDSRVCMAAALLSPIAREQAAFNCTNTNPSHAKDYSVVSGMADEFGFPLGIRSSDTKVAVRTTRRFKESLGLWHVANAGVYDFLVLPNYVLNSVGAFNFSGHGAELHKGNYGWRPVQAIAANIKSADVSSAFLKQSEKALSSLGVETNSQVGSEWHYLAYRNALHGGQVSTTSMVGFRPLMMRDLVALNRSDGNPFPRPKKGGASMVNDVLITLSPEAAAFEFDDPKKNMSVDYIGERVRELDGCLTEGDIETYSIFGDYGSVASGFPGFFRAVADLDGKWVEPSRGSLASAAIDGYERIGDLDVRNAYLPVLKEAVAKLLDPALAYQQMGGSVGKLLSMNLLS